MSVNLFGFLVKKAKSINATIDKATRQIFAFIKSLEDTYLVGTLTVVCSFTGHSFDAVDYIFFEILHKHLSFAGVSFF